MCFNKSSRACFLLPGVMPRNPFKFSQPRAPEQIWTKYRGLITTCYYCKLINYAMNITANCYALPWLIHNPFSTYCRKHKLIFSTRFLYSLKEQHFCSHSQGLRRNAIQATKTRIHSSLSIKVRVERSNLPTAHADRTRNIFLFCLFYVTAG